MSVPNDAVAARHKNAALGPSLSATNPDSVALIEAPMPDAVPTMPCASIRVTSKHELKQRIMAGIDDVNRHPVIHTWSYKLAEVPDMIRTMETLI